MKNSVLFLLVAGVFVLVFSSSAQASHCYSVNCGGRCCVDEETSHCFASDLDGAGGTCYDAYPGPVNGHTCNSAVQYYCGNGFCYTCSSSGSCSGGSTTGACGGASCIYKSTWSGACGNACSYSAACPACPCNGKLNGAGNCDSACGANAACNGIAPGGARGSCKAGGYWEIHDKCNANCEPADRDDLLCREVGVADCEGIAACDSKKPGQCIDSDEYCNVPGEVSVGPCKNRVDCGNQACRSDYCGGVNTATITQYNFPASCGKTCSNKAAFPRHDCNNCGGASGDTGGCAASTSSWSCTSAQACTSRSCAGTTYYCQYDGSSWLWKTSSADGTRCGGSSQVGCTDSGTANGGGSCSTYRCSGGTCQQSGSTVSDTCLGTVDSPSLTYYSCSASGTCSSNTNNGGTDSCSDSGTNSDTGVLNGLRIGGGSCSATNWQCSGTPGVISSPSQSLSDSCTGSVDSPGLTYYTCSGTDGGSVNDNCQSNSYAPRSDYCSDSGTNSDTGVLNGLRIGKGSCNSTNWQCSGSPASVSIATANVSDAATGASTAENPRLYYYACGGVDGGSVSDSCPQSPYTPPGVGGDWCTDNGTQYGGGACGAQNWSVFGAGTPGDPAWVGVNSTGVLVGQGVDACGGVYSENVSYWNCSAVGGSALNTCLPAPNACGMNSSCPSDKPELLASCSRFCANDLGLGQDWSGSGICKVCTPECRGVGGPSGGGVSGFSSLVCESVIVGNTSLATARYLVNSSPVCSPGSLVNASVSWEGSALPAFLVSVSPDCSANLWNIGFPSDANGTYVVVVNATDGSGASASCSGRRYVISATAQTPDFDLLLLPVIALLGLLLARRKR